MNDHLNREISLFFEQHPELKNSQLVFEENSFTIQPLQETASTLLPLCEQKEIGPDFLRGTSEKIEARKSTVHVYGIFAKEIIEEGELIEENKFLKLNLRSNYLHDSVIKDYVWGNKDCTCENCKQHGGFSYLGFGYISLYNHSDSPNTKLNLNFKTETYQVYAKTKIEKDKEIFVTYGNKYWLIRDFWNHVHKTDGISKFHKANIQPKINE